MANEKRTYDERIDHIAAFLGSELPTTTAGLKSDLSALFVSHKDILEARIAAQTKLYAERNRLRYPKDKDYTDWDRKIMLDEATSAVQADYEWLAGLEKALELRINVIRDML